MLLNKHFDHIGLAAVDSKKCAEWYQQVLGFRVIGSFTGGNGNPVFFLQNQEAVYEIFQPVTLAPEVQGKIDHIAYTSDDLDRDFQYCQAQGCEITTDGIQTIPSFWEHGVRFFKIRSATGEQVEFCQKV